MKPFLIVFFALFAGMALYSCNGSHSSSEGNKSSEPVSNSGNSSTTMSNSSSTIDVNAPSKSEGVGKFKDVNIPSAIDPKMAATGKDLFQTHCTACHQATDQKLIGPGLKGITKIRTPEWIMNMITNPDEMVQKDPVAKELYNQFNHTQMTNQGLTGDQARDVYEFFRQNDAQ